MSTDLQQELNDTLDCLDAAIDALRTLALKAEAMASRLERKLDTNAAKRAAKKDQPQ